MDATNLSLAIPLRVEFCHFPQLNMKRKPSDSLTVEDIRSLSSETEQLSNLLSDERFQSKDYVEQIQRALQEMERSIRYHELQAQETRSRVAPLRNLYKLICWASQPSKTQEKKTSLPGPFFDATVVVGVGVLFVANLLV